MNLTQLFFGQSQKVRAKKWIASDFPFDLLPDILCGPKNLYEILICRL